jgi:hypothetical protein
MNWLIRRGLSVIPIAFLVAIAFAFPSYSPARVSALSVVHLSTASAIHGSVMYGENPVARENAQQGTPAWAIRSAPPEAVEAYTSETDVLPGGPVHFHISTGARYRVAVYRLGWYRGDGGRLVGCSPADCSDVETGVRRPMPSPDPFTGKLVAGWPVTDVVRIPTDATSGYYVARILLADGDAAGKGGTVPFVVGPPDSQRSSVLVQVPVNTWEAYNPWGGRSLYDPHRANRVSFDRPYGIGSQGPFYTEIQLVRFLEREGVDVSYQSDVATHFAPTSLLMHRLIIMAGHDEYWTKEMRDAFDGARDLGTNLAFMGSNAAYWQVRYEDGGRTIVGYKSLADPIADPAVKTIQFRDLGRPECELGGVMHMFLRPHQSGPIDYTVTASAAQDPWFAGTGFKPGDVVKGVVNDEWDAIPNPPPAECAKPTLTVLFHYDGTPNSGNADAVRYVAPSAARVFSAGGQRFSWGLDTWGTNSFGWTEPPDARLQQFVRNMLVDLTRPAPPQGYDIRVKRRGVLLHFLLPKDPRISALRISRQEHNRIVPVCTTKSGRCRNRVRTDGRIVRYLAETLDEWGTSQPLASRAIRLKRGWRVHSP